MTQIDWNKFPPNKLKQEKTSTEKLSPDKPEEWERTRKPLLRESKKQSKEKKCNNKHPKLKRNSQEKELSQPSRREQLILDKEMHSKQQITSSDTASTWETLSASIRVSSLKVDLPTQSHPHTSTPRALPSATVAASSLKRISQRLCNACVLSRSPKGCSLNSGKTTNCLSQRVSTYNNCDTMLKTIGSKEFKSTLTMVWWRKFMKWKMGKMWRKRLDG